MNPLVRMIVAIFAGLTIGTLLGIAMYNGRARAAEVTSVALPVAPEKALAPVVILRGAGIAAVRSPSDDSVMTHDVVVARKSDGSIDFDAYAPGGSRSVR